MDVKRRGFLAGLLACPTCAAIAHAEEAAHWSYEGTEAGPAKWGELNSAFNACTAGQQQSPVDLHDGIRSQLPPFRPHWRSEAFKVVNNGHTLQLNASPGSYVEVGHSRYDLVQFHFHTPSEHAVNGKRTAMEVHFVHQNAEKQLSVLGVFLVSGGRNAAFASIMVAAQPKLGEAALKTAINPSALMPPPPAGGKSWPAWRYEGSLTTPPCSEIVNWIVLERPVPVAQADIAAFQAIFPHNARPLEPLNRRFLLRG